MISEVKLYVAIIMEFFLSDNHRILGEGIINTSRVNRQVPCGNPSGVHWIYTNMVNQLNGKLL
jgi:hypothetical protein